VDDNVGPARGRPAQGVRHSKRLLVDAHDDLGLGIEEGGATHANAFRLGILEGDKL
jgi:hypothetical protein